MSAGEFDSALADDRVVLVFERLREFVDVRDLRGAQDLLARGFRIAERDVVVDRLREEERVLRHDAEVPAVVVKAKIAERLSVDEDFAGRGLMERRHQRDQRALSRP